MALCEREQALDEGDAELFAACALGRLAAVVGIAQQSSEDDSFGVPRRRGGRPVVGLAEESLSKCVDDHVGGAGVEGDDIRRVAPPAARG